MSDEGIPINEEAILALAQQYPKPDGLIEYGTAGFRFKADILDSIVFRTGLTAALRSRKLGGQTVGIMITASHNPPEDNGVKLVDPMGEMLEEIWEEYATNMANVRDEDIVDAYHVCEKVVIIDPTMPARIAFARDTRASGAHLVKILMQALDAAGAEYTDYKILTTPQLHYLTRCTNTEGTPQTYGLTSEKGYYEKLGAAYARAIKGKKIDGSLYVDCANGVGGPKLAELIKHLPSIEKGGININLVNTDVHRPEKLNDQCGADFVKTRQRPPQVVRGMNEQRCCSLDGDADRIVYYFEHPYRQFRLLDGDKIATLAATFIVDLAQTARLDQVLKIGVIQTAYANGNATKYVTKNLRLPVVCTPTGVKHLHHAATKFDVGVYFEANGHGTVLFSQTALYAFHNTQPESPAQAEALYTLCALTDLINQTVGDALSDMLLVEVILAHRAWTANEWDQMYTDLPNRLVRVNVRDRREFVATDAERKLVHPDGVQNLINTAVGKVRDGRGFARASGTENAVRVYAEAASRAEADELAAKIVGFVRAENRGV